MTKWIKSENKLPELDKNILVWVENEPMIAMREYQYDHDNECDSWGWYIREYSFGSKILIKYWAEIQEPPEAE